jgi:hypothetical protein
LEAKEDVALTEGFAYLSIQEPIKQTKSNINTILKIQKYKKNTKKRGSMAYYLWKHFGNAATYPV